MKFAIAADHAGFELKEAIGVHLRELGYELTDLGACTFDPLDDYPDFAESLAKAIQKGEADRGVLICGSGVGASIAANKVKGVRAGLCHDTYSAHQGVEHDDMNVLVLGSRIIGLALAKELVETYCKARFSGDPRHQRRLGKVKAIERAQ